MPPAMEYFGDDRLPASKLESKGGYYYGLHFQPVLIARTGAPWKAPTWAPGDTWLRSRELKTVGDHPTMTPAVWEDADGSGQLALQIHSILESHDVKWTSTDVARIPYTDEYNYRPVEDNQMTVIVWIGVTPGTLSRERGLAVADECKRVLVERGILDVEVEIRESVVTRYATSGSKLHKPRKPAITSTIRGGDSAVDVHHKLTPTIGLSICNAETPWGPEGTGGFYVADGKAKLYFVTARHVLFKTETGQAYRYDDEVSGSSNEGPRIDVALLGSEAFNNYTEEIKKALRSKESTIHRMAERSAADTGLSANDRADDERDAKKAAEELRQLYQEVKSPEWSDIDNRIIGHVRFSPPLQYGTGPHGYTQDYAVVEVDSSKIDAENYGRNSIALGTEIGGAELMGEMMGGRLSHGYRSSLYPFDGLYKVQGIIPDEDLRRLAVLDEGGKGNSVEGGSAPQCLTVLKRGNGTGLTLGHANNFMSYVRNYFDDGSPPKTSKEWAIFPSSIKYGGWGRSHPFSGPGDSGAGVVDGFGRLGGLITGGDGDGSTPDGMSCITYATPTSFILDSLKEHGFDVTLEVTAGDAKLSFK